MPSVKGISIRPVAFLICFYHLLKSLKFHTSVGENIPRCPWRFEGIKIIILSDSRRTEVPAAREINFDDVPASCTAGGKVHILGFHIEVVSYFAGAMGQSPPAGSHATAPSGADPPGEHITRSLLTAPNYGHQIG
jgi:hypothetical protein